MIPEDELIKMTEKNPSLLKLINKMDMGMDFSRHESVGKSVYENYWKLKSKENKK